MPPVPRATQMKTYLRALDPRAGPGVAGAFVIFAQGRSGSTLLGELLGSHPRVVFADEILFDRVRFPRAWVRGQRARHRDECYGFHVKVYQLTDAQRVASPQMWLSSMQHAGWKIIHLHRENLVRQALSTVIAFKRVEFHQRAGGGKPSRAPIDVRPEELQQAIDTRVLAGSMDAAALVDVPHVSAVYERDLLDPLARQSFADRIFADLGLTSAPVSVTLERTGADRLEDLVTSAAELRAHFDGTEWRAWLDRP